MVKSKKVNKAEITTIKLAKKTKERLDHLKEHDTESYDNIINKALNIINICLSKPLLANRILRDIERNRKREKLIENPEKLLKKRILKTMNNSRENSEINTQNNQRIIRPINNISNLNQQRIPPRFISSERKER